MTREDQEVFATAIAVALARALHEGRSVTDPEHHDHHRWITAEIKKTEERALFWRQMKDHLAKWGVISVGSALGYAFYLGVRAWLKATMSI